MVKFCFVNKFFIGLIALIASVAAAPDLTGTWCAQQEGLTMRFTADSIYVTSARKEGVNGHGVFTLNDTLFTATMINNEVTITMGYRYVRENARTIKAKVAFFKIDDEPATPPDRWMRMDRCDIVKKIAAPDTVHSKTIRPH